MEFTICNLRAAPQLAARAADWFAEKWSVPREEYAGSIALCQAQAGAVPQWYLALQGDEIAGGCGVIANDFHDRPDLTPNLCALFVEPPCRNRGLAGQLLAHARADMASLGVPALYLVTEHTSCYERYGWRYRCQAGALDEPGLQLRLYESPAGTAL